MAVSRFSQVFVARFFAACISRQIVRFQPKLRRQKTRDFQRNDLSRGQQATGVAQRTKLESKAETIVWAATGADDFQIVIRKGVVAQHRRFIGWKVKKR